MMNHDIEVLDAIITEAGNGLPDVGDLVGGNDTAYRVIQFLGPVQTGRSSGAGNWIRASVSPVDWADMTDEEADDIVCSATITTEGGA